MSLSRPKAIVEMVAGWSLSVLVLGAFASAALGPKPKPKPGPGPTAQESERELRTIHDLRTFLQTDPEVNAQQIIKEMPSVEDLAQRRVAMAEQMMEQSLLKAINPPSPTAERAAFSDGLRDYLDWSLRRMEARIDLAEDFEAELEVLAQEVVKIRRLEQAYPRITEAEGIGTSPGFQNWLRAHRLDLETRLVRRAASKADGSS